VSKAAADINTVRVCPNCGFSHLRSSRAHSFLEQFQAWWSRTGWFRCETCKWRGRLRDVWDPNAAFPHLPPLRLGRDLDIEFLQQRDEESLVDLVLSRQADLRGQLRIWLDDSRPAPTGWLRVTTVTSARRLLQAGLVAELSLDYDLGWCADCLGSGEHLKRSGQRHCPHTPTGFDLVEWMAQTQHWSAVPPTVHSGNIEGGARMLGVIARQWRDPKASGPSEGPKEPAATTDVSSGSVTTLTTCPQCGGARLYRTHRRSNLDRLRSMLTRRYPVRCEACGWTRWSKAPILVRLSPGADAPTERIETERFEQIDPDR
jgi:hypothetical protein